MSDGTRVSDLLRSLEEREQRIEALTDHARRLEDEVRTLRQQLFDAQADLVTAHDADTIPVPSPDLPLPKHARVARVGRALANITDARKIALEIGSVQMATALRSAELFAQNYIEALQ